MPVDTFAPRSSSLSRAWAESFLHAMGPGVTDISPLVVTIDEITDGTVVECCQIRDLLDTQLRSRGKPTCQTVASTIFPESLWNPGSPDDAEDLYRRFDAAWPEIHQCRPNRRGTYFRRLTAYCPKDGSDPVNQLKQVVSTYRAGNHRRSALQAAIFDPTLDHNDCRQLGFPCLHQVAFTPLNEDGLGVTGFYGMQYLFEKAYGNYVGLCRLGRFMAKQMGLRFVRLVCVASVATLGGVSKAELRAFANDLERTLSNQDGKLQ